MIVVNDNRSCYTCDAGWPCPSPINDLKESKTGKEKPHASSLSETLESVRTRIAKYRGKNLSEANTKTALIEPVLCALGWPVGDLDEVSLEFRLKSSDNPVDYALLLVDSVLVAVGKL